MNGSPGSKISTTSLVKVTASGNVVGVASGLEIGMMLYDSYLNTTSYYRPYEKYKDKDI